MRQSERAPLSPNTLVPGYLIIMMIKIAIIIMIIMMTAMIEMGMQMIMVKIIFLAVDECH